MAPPKRWLILGMFFSAGFCQTSLLAFQGLTGVSQNPGILPIPTRIPVPIATPGFQGLRPSASSTPGFSPTPTPTLHFVPGVIVGTRRISVPSK